MKFVVSAETTLSSNELKVKLLERIHNGPMTNQPFETKSLCQIILTLIETVEILEDKVESLLERPSSMDY